ncbi:50S ribosomal protein L11 methyltransferase [Bacillus piscicola]|uniref:50S ribosomal protein L11 methyltransferase n=1 Tax=Bacillus piscicola TaxID=1632684 RepID=UPI001F0962BE
MNWIEFSVHTTHEAAEPVSNILHESGASGVVIVDSQDLEKDWPAAEDEIIELSPADYPKEGVIIKAYYPEETFTENNVRGIEESINNLRQYDINLGANEVNLQTIREEEWADAWKKYYKPVRITEQLTITPSWEHYEPLSRDEKIIKLDPGMAFGTGTHPTTTLCLQMLEKLLKGGESVIDVGTGSGILSIAAAKLGAGSITAIDVDETAVRVARENALLNDTDKQVQVKQSDLLHYTDMQADVVVANILAEIIMRLADDAFRVLRPGGKFITSGIISRKADDVRNVLEQSGFHVVERTENEDWVAFAAKKKS